MQQAGVTVLYNETTEVVTNGGSITYSAGSTSTYDIDTPVTYPNGANITYINVNVQALDPVECGYWYGTGVVDALGGLFDPTLAGLGTHAVTFIVKKGDCIEEATIDITIEDVENPEFDYCPTDLEQTTNSCVGLVVVPIPTATDNCGIESITHIAIHEDGTIVSEADNATVGQLFPVGVTTITWTATDLAGNTAICETTVTVTDVMPPLIFCTTDEEGTTEEGICEGFINVATPNAVDLTPFPVDGLSLIHI